MAPRTLNKLKPLQVAKLKQPEQPGMGAVLRAGEGERQGAADAPRGSPMNPDDLIPEGCIRSSDAFELYWQATAPTQDAIRARRGEILSNADPAEHCAENGPVPDAAWMARAAESQAIGEARSDAEERFREALGSGALTLLIRDPETGDVLTVARDMAHREWNWSLTGFFRRDAFMAWLSPHSDPNAYYTLPEKEPKGAKKAAAWRELRIIFKNEPGVPRSLSDQHLADRVNGRLGGNARRHVSPDTIGRLLRG